MSEAINFNRIVVLYSGGGSMVLRRLLEKLSEPLTFSDYMYKYQSKIFGLKKGLFTSDFDLICKRKIDNMDITLLCKLCFLLFDTKLTADQKQYVSQIKEKRNKLLHSTLLEKATIKNKDYHKLWHDMEQLLLAVTKTIDSIAFMETVNDFLQSTKISVPNVDEVFEELRKACLSNDDVAEKVEKLAPLFHEQKILKKPPNILQVNIGLVLHHMIIILFFSCKTLLRIIKFLHKVIVFIYSVMYFIARVVTEPEIIVRKMLALLLTILFIFVSGIVILNLIFRNHSRTYHTEMVTFEHQAYM